MPCSSKVPEVAARRLSRALRRPTATLAALALLTARPAAAVDIEDGTVLLGVDGGFGSPQGGAGKAMGQAGIVGGQALYYPRGEYALGLQVDRFDFKSTGTDKADMTSLMAVSRGAFGDWGAYWPYALFGLGYAESRADVANGTDRGSGFAFCLGTGVQRMFGKRAGIAVELRLHRLGAPLPRMGLSGATVGDLVVRLDLWFAPQANPFRD